MLGAINDTDTVLRQVAMNAFYWCALKKLFTPVTFWHSIVKSMDFNKIFSICVEVCPVYNSFHAIIRNVDSTLLKSRQSLSK